MNFFLRIYAICEYMFSSKLQKCCLLVSWDNAALTVIVNLMDFINFRCLNCRYELAISFVKSELMYEIDEGMI